jgi:hypothetical protein
VKSILDVKLVLNVQQCIVKVGKCKQSSILTSVQNTNSLYLIAKEQKGKYSLDI